ncbi:hypothetical protein PAPYR_2267 [Paratrimastix pyriformis]|uniref:Ankyrin repeat protein n=1 Tax=Paratrimastix pyriformis TaxID=342808 RepID=A0ABQ8UU26_9EUKA|nr:hypothetical protein PAPYR_2267 [Paratrimastix pyriformis]
MGNSLWGAIQEGEKTGDFTALRKFELLDLCANTNEAGETPLRYAIRQGSAPLLRALMQAGVVPSLLDAKFAFSSSSSLDCLQQIISSLDMEKLRREVAPESRRPLLATHAGNLIFHVNGDNIALAQLIADVGFPLDEPDESGVTPLSAALSMASPPWEILEFLCSHPNVNVNRLTPGVPPLLTAIRSGNLRLVALLLHHGADANAPLVPRMTPLMVATEAGHADMIRALLEHGARVEATIWKPGQPVHLCAPVLALLTNRPQLLDVLLSARPDRPASLPLIPGTGVSQWALRTAAAIAVPHPDSLGPDVMLMLLMARAGAAESVALFLAAGTSPNAEYRGVNALVVNTHAAVTRVLLQAGADPNALAGAVKLGNLALVRALLAHGADPNRATLIPAGSRPSSGMTRPPSGRPSSSSGLLSARSDSQTTARPQDVLLDFEEDITSVMGPQAPFLDDQPSPRTAPQEGKAAADPPPDSLRVDTPLVLALQGGRADALWTWSTTGAAASWVPMRRSRGCWPGGVSTNRLSAGRLPLLEAIECGLGLAAIEALLQAGLTALFVAHLRGAPDLLARLAPRTAPTSTPSRLARSLADGRWEGRLSVADRLHTQYALAIGAPGPLGFLTGTHDLLGVTVPIVLQCPAGGDDLAGQANPGDDDGSRRDLEFLYQDGSAVYRGRIVARAGPDGVGVGAVLSGTVHQLRGMVWAMEGEVPGRMELGRTK